MYRRCGCDRWCCNVCQRVQGRLIVCPSPGNTYLTIHPCRCIGDINFIVVLERREEMFYMTLSGVLDSEVIDNEDEEDGLPFVSPQSGSCGTLVVSVVLAQYSA